MSNTNSKQLKLGAILSYFQIGLSIIIGICYTPMMLKSLGKSEYGLYNLASSTISMLSVLSLGFNSSYIKYYSKYKTNNDTQSIFKLNGLFLVIFVIIGLIALGSGLFLSYNLNLVFDKGLTSEEYDLARKLMVILTINLALTFPASVFTSIITAHEKFVFLKLLGMVKTVLSPLINIPLLLIGYRSLMLVSVSFCISIIVDIIYIVFVLMKLKQKFLFKKYDKGLFKSLLMFTSFIALELIVDQINLNIDKLLLGRFKGSDTVAVYSLGYVLYSYYSLLSSSISGVFTTRVHSIVGGNNCVSQKNEQLTTLFIKVGRIQFLILALVSSGFIFFGKAFIVNFWADHNYHDSYIVALMLLASSIIPLMQNIGIEIQRALDKHKFRSIVYLIMAVLNLVISIFLCQLYGAIGATIGTVISFIVANGIIMNIYYYKACKINIKLFWCSILRLSIGLIIPIGCGIMILYFVELSNIIMFLLMMAMYIFVYCLSMWFFGMNKFEKGLVLSVVHRQK